MVPVYWLFTEGWLSGLKHPTWNRAYVGKATYRGFESPTFHIYFTNERLLAMEILRNLIPFVNEQMGVQKKLSEKYTEDWRKNLHLESAKKFEAMASDLNEAILQFAKLNEEKAALNHQILSLKTDLETCQSQLAVSRGGEQPDLNKILYLHPDELDGLPDEVIAELSESARDKTDVQILDVIEGNGGFITLDQLLVRMYKQYGEAFKRANLNARLYRMTQSKALYPVPGKKGAYTTNPNMLEEGDLFGNE